MITQQDFLLWLNHCTFAEAVQRIDAFADCAERGLVAIVADRDSFEALAPTPAGLAVTLPPLPSAAA